MTPQRIQSLLNDPSEVCVSLYMPMFRWGREVRQNEIRFKNLLKDVQQLLEKDEASTPETHHGILGQLKDFLHDIDQDVWKHPSAGLALFVTPDSLEVLSMGFAMEEQVHVGERFYLRPLLPALHGDGSFVVLAVSQKHVRLFEGNRDSLEERHPEDLPDNLKDALNIDDYITSIQHFSYATGNHVDTMYHGQGGGDDDHKANILQFFHRIDDPLSDYLEGREDPLIFAGVDYLFPIFKEASSYPQLLVDAIEGNFDEASVDELHQKALKVVEPYFQAETTEAIENYHDAYGRNCATDDLETILQAAQMGAIDTLLIREKTPIWGHLDEEGHVQQDASPGEFSLDLLDEAAVETLEKGGDVYVVRDADFPSEKHSAVAKLRFAIEATTSS
ncbi:hypothetical protein [Blastopirellula marina]|uniref:Uncharacterized protein n=1 Tax=Blastopirellula marina TaxID=124 RepID=A0A2S8GEU4_9BACT|nr:hypothetical protein [Blastopirellula marina]PQO42830.1 hypothetical protein C5Y98_01360 [Blastopirellula marina]PTL46596.1 hypothetical protein C5Y97_01360 [Blastopirellula marina]